MPSSSLAVASSPSFGLSTSDGHDAMSPAPTRIASVAAVTVIVAWPFFPSLVAVIVALPAATPPTSPLVLTVATAALLVAHVPVRPVSGLPDASLGVAVSCTVAPTCTLADAGVTATEATGTLVTEMADVPLFPPLVAVIVAEPTATPVTKPLLPTVTAPVLELVQV